MGAAITVVLSILAIVYIAYPFYQSRKRKVSFELNHRAEELEARKTEIYAAIKDIEFDFEMGKLSESDYNELKSQYKTDAVDLLKEIDMIEQSNRRPRRKGKKAGASRFCPECGAPASKDDRFCASCGQKLA